MDSTLVNKLVIDFSKCNGEIKELQAWQSQTESQWETSKCEFADKERDTVYEEILGAYDTKISELIRRKSHICALLDGINIRPTLNSLADAQSVLELYVYHGYRGRVVYVNPHLDIGDVEIIEDLLHPHIEVIVGDDAVIPSVAYDDGARGSVLKLFLICMGVLFIPFWPLILLLSPFESTQKLDASGTMCVFKPPQCGIIAIEHPFCAIPFFSAHRLFSHLAAYRDTIMKLAQLFILVCCAIQAIS